MKQEVKSIDNSVVDIQTGTRTNNQAMAENFPKFNQWQIANFAPGDETWAHYFEPFRKVGNTIIMAYQFYTTFTNFSTKYLVMCNVYTDVGGIK